MKPERGAKKKIAGGNKVHVRFSDQHMTWIDKLMKKHGMTRSAVVQHAVSIWADLEKVK